MRWQKNIPLIVGISLPILMVIFVAVSVYLPGLFIQPNYNFLYSDYGGYNNKYFVKDNHLSLNPNFRQDYYPYQAEPKIYLHDVKLNKSQEITFEEAQRLTLDSNYTSPDGFEITSGGNSGGFFPFYFYSGSDYQSKYLSGKVVSKKLDLNLSSRYYDFLFLGWIIN